MESQVPLSFYQAKYRKFTGNVEILSDGTSETLPSGLILALSQIPDEGIPSSDFTLSRYIDEYIEHGLLSVNNGRITRTHKANTARYRPSDHPIIFRPK